MAQKVVSGHRIKVGRFNPATGKTEIVGIFSEVSFNVNVGAVPIFILGRSSAAAIQYTHMEPISVRMRAYRSIDHGPYVDGGMPLLQDLLKNEYTRLSLYDRQLELDGRDGLIGEITDMVITGFDTSVSSKNVVEYTVSGMGILIKDESAKNAEAAGATDLP
jgi:hypothetical protein